MVIRAGDFLERFFGARVAAIDIRVIFFHQLAVLRFDFCFITRVFEVKGGERIFVAGVDGFGVGFVIDAACIAEHAAEGFLELGGGVAFHLVDAPGGAVAGRGVALEVVDFLFAHAFEIVPFFVERGDVLLAEPLVFVQMVAAARRAEVALVQAIAPIAAVAGRFHTLRFFSLCHIGVISRKFRKLSTTGVGKIMGVADQMEKLIVEHFAPREFHIQDDSAQHAGHAGARAGGESHFKVIVVSEKFEGLNAVARHRLVYAALKPLIDAGLHALVIEARTVGEVG